MAGRSKTTTDHEVIRKWVEDRGGKPATVRRTEDKDEPGVLRVDFPGYGRDESRHSLEEISWDDFFQKFDEKDLAFLYQDEMKSGKPSRFFKLVSRGTAEAKEEQNRESAARHGGEGNEAKAEKPASRSRRTTSEAKAKDGNGEAKSEARGRAKSAEAGGGNGSETKSTARRSTSRSKQDAQSRAERDAKHAETEARQAGAEAKQAERDAKQAGREARQEKK